MSSTSPVSPKRAEQRIALLEKHFFTRIDMVAALMAWGSPHPVEGGAGLRALLTAHVMGSDAPTAVVRYSNRRGDTKVEKGRYRIGSYTPDVKGLTRWLCLDLDAHDHADGLRDPDLAVRRNHAVFQSLGIPSYIEQSGGGKGWHLWVFFSEPVSAKDVRRLAHLAAPRDLPLVSGRLVDARVNRGIEVFPKQNKIKKKRGFGNLLWLPFWAGAPSGANSFYAEENDKLLPFEPESFDTVSPAQLAGSLAALEGAQTTNVQKDVGSGAVSRPDPSRATADDEAIQAFLNRVDKDESAAPPPSDDWRRWREEAQSKLSLEEIYGDIFTGEYSGEHWLRCQDPDSSSGPESRSGSVADGNGEAARGTFHSFRTEETMSVFDFMVLRGMATDFRDALRKVSEMTGVPLPQTRKEDQGATPTAKDGYPVIVINNRQLRDIIWDIRRVLLAASSRNPFLFLRSGRPTRLLYVDGFPQMDILDETAMYGLIVRHADWVRRTDEGDQDATPPISIARDLVSHPDRNLTPLDAVVTAPVFDAEGNLASEPGYHPGAALWHHPLSGFNLPPVPKKPSDDELDRARSLILDELLVDFPFVSEADRAHAVAALLLPFVRRLIPGPTPIHLFEAATPGSGKTLLAEVVNILATGAKAEPLTLGRDDEETRKKITSVLSLGRPVVLIDNVRSGIDSATLAAALTADTWQDRLLGQNKMIRLPNRVVWLFTANNPNLTMEIARRCIRIRIEPPSDRPWERDDFKHSPLKLWVEEHREELVWALLVLVRAWISNGSPAGVRTLGSFEHWATVIGGIIEEAGIGGFLGNTEELYEAADAEGQEWREFVQTWWDEQGKLPVSAGTLLRLAQDRDMLLSVLGSKSERSQAIRLGKALKANRNRRFDGLRIESAGTSRTKQNRWQLVKEDEIDEAEVLDLFGSREVPRDVEAKRGMLQEVENPTSRGDSPSDTSTESGVRGMSRDVNPTLADAITHKRAHDAHMRTREGSTGTLPATSRGEPETQTDQASQVQEVENQHPAQHPAKPTKHPAAKPEPPNFDLATLEDEEEVDE